MVTGTAQFIKVKTKDGEILDFAIQQYEVGLYVCINKDGRMVDQFGSTKSQEQFVKLLKNDDNLEILES
ncbi:MAG: hypothetical protein ACXQT0_04735 [Candidatus Methanofastidiosia archaeon]